MLTLRQFAIAKILSESDDGKLKHLDHPEDHLFSEGKSGLHRAIHSLKSVAEGHSDVTQKVDGAPSVVAGHMKDPRDGKTKPFIATKSAFNKDPKINFSHEDIEANHGHAPGLVEKLKAGLDHFHKVLPKKGIYQGDMMFTPGDLHHDGGATTFTPNTISYTARGKEADKIRKAQVGAVFHTKYEGNGDLAERSAEPMSKEDISKFGEHQDVWLRGAHMDHSPIPNDKKKEFDDHIKQAEVAAKKGGDKMFQATAMHQGKGNHLTTYFNSCVRDGKRPSALGFRDHVKTKLDKEVDKVKSDAAKQKKMAESQAHTSHIENNLDHYENMFKVHNHLQDAKHVLVNHYNGKQSDIEHHIDGNKADPEGFVANTPHGMIKLIDRKKFSAANFNSGKIQAAKAAKSSSKE